MARMINKMHVPNNDCIKKCGYCFEYSPLRKRVKSGQRQAEKKNWRKEYEVG